MSEQFFDVVIVGSGMAGSALAASLAGSDLSVAVIEAQPIKPGWPDMGSDVNGFDLRVSALTAASQALLDRLGAWSLITSQRVSPYNKMRVWDGDGTGAIGFDAADIHHNELGHIVENRIIVAALLQRLQLAPNVALLNPVKVESMTRIQGESGEQKGYQLKLDSGLSINTGLVVGADGAMSRVRSWADFKTREWDYGHHGLVATIETENGHQQTAWQRFMTSGPLALLPLTPSHSDSDLLAIDRFASIVWSTQPEHAEELLALDDEAFCERLTQASEARLGKIKSVSRRVAFPLRQRHAIDYVQPHVALIADAAHTIHPLAGQGINIGFHDVEVLSEELLRAKAKGVAVGDMAALTRYQRRCKGTNLAMMATMQGFKELFGHEALPIRWLRNEGMKRLNSMNFAKNWLIKQAMGL